MRTTASIFTGNLLVQMGAFFLYIRKWEKVKMSDDNELNKKSDVIKTDGISRRNFLKTGGAVLGGFALMSMISPGIRTGAWAAGSDAPEKKTLKIGFIPLTDCASVVMADELGLYKKYGLDVTVSKEASWAGVRDKLVNGELDAAHVLYGLMYGVQMGIGGQQKDMAVLMCLNNNGQAITLSNQSKAKGVVDGASLKKLIDKI